MTNSSGKLFRARVTEFAPLPILGTINAYCALLAEKAGAKAIYISGAGVANASYGLPDLGMTSLTDVLEDVRRIHHACPLPMLVDVDTGWGHAFNIARTVQLMESAGVAAIHLEDQISAKRCGHRPHKAIVSKEEMGDRIKVALDARVDANFVIMARTDAYAIEGLAGAIERAQFYQELGADMIFAEAMPTLADYTKFTQNLSCPVLANMTEFGQTPILTRKDFKNAGVQLILYPLSAFRAMSYAAFNTYRTILEQGTQESLLDSMQNREDLYEVLKYYEFEKKLDQCQGEAS